jgi:hypothetical protein
MQVAEAVSQACDAKAVEPDTKMKANNTRGFLKVFTFYTPL